MEGAIIVIEVSALDGFVLKGPPAQECQLHACPPVQRCNIDATGWLNGGHPTVADGQVSR